MYFIMYRCIAEPLSSDGQSVFDHILHSDMLLDDGVVLLDECDIADVAACKSHTG